MIGHPEVILIVDDEALDLDLMRRALADFAGFTVWDADRFDSAMKLFHDHSGQIDLLLVDVSLPGRNGVELAKELLREKPDLKVLFISGHVGAEVIRFYGLPATDRHLLQKPFKAADLIARVRETLQSGEPLPRLGPRPNVAESKAQRGK
jgi:DNA-binding response OmpR family regulator